MVAKYNPEQYWTATVKIILAAPSREAVIAALGSKLGSPSPDGIIVDWGFARYGQVRDFPRPCFTNPARDGHPEDFIALRDQVKQDEAHPRDYVDEHGNDNARAERSNLQEQWFDRV